MARTGDAILVAMNNAEMRAMMAASAENIK